MASYLKKKIVCSCCGKPFEADLLRGFFSNQVPDLDGNRHEPAAFDKVIICPNCGYSTDNISEKISFEGKEMVSSESYQILFRNDDINTVLKKQLLFAMVKEAEGKDKKAALAYLAAYWISKNLGEKNEDFLEKAVNRLMIHLEEHEDHTGALILIDCLRQLSRFEEAEETADSLYPFVQNRALSDVVRLEQELIRLQDAEPHSQSEVRR